MNNDELIDKLMKPVLAAKTMNDIYNRAREAVKNSLTVLDAMSEQLRKSNSELAELEASSALHRNLNREVAIALGLKSGDSWHDLPKRVIDLRKRIAELEAFVERMIEVGDVINGDKDSVWTLQTIKECWTEDVTKWKERE